MAKICSLKKVSWDWALLWRLAVVIAIMAVLIVYWGIIGEIFIGYIISAFIIAIIEEQLKPLNGP